MLAGQLRVPDVSYADNSSLRDDPAQAQHFFIV
jgi:hypothetical protein